MHFVDCKCSAFCSALITGALQTIHKKNVLSGKREEEGGHRDIAEKTTQKHYPCLCHQLVGFRDKQTIFLQAFLKPQGVCCRRFQPAVVSRS